MADATTAAKDRIDRALAELERKIAALKDRPPVADDDLFAPRPAADSSRVAELEAAARAASEALATAAEEVRAILSEPEGD